MKKIVLKCFLKKPDGFIAGTMGGSGHLDAVVLKKRNNGTDLTFFKTGQVETAHNKINRLTGLAANFIEDIHDAGMGTPCEQNDSLF